MVQAFFVAAQEAVRTLRANLVHTLLSTLGIIIGVGALVAILSLGDGMERFGREQIAATTDLAAVYVSPNTQEQVDGMWMKKEYPAILGETEAARIDSLFKNMASVQLQLDYKVYIKLEGDTLQKPAVVRSGLANFFPDTTKLAAGRVFGPSDFERKEAVAVLSADLAGRLSRGGDSTALVGRKLAYEGRSVQIIGILAPKEKMQQPTVCVPFYLVPEEKIQANPPDMMLVANKVEDAQAVKTRLEKWLDGHVPGGSKAFTIMTNDFRLEQVAKGILVFKIIMGMITGIAVLVGGIGVMNVLLMSITERTREIGIRKALGAKRSTIALQFLAESLTISLAGCFLGLCLGMLFMTIAVPLIKHFAEVPFSATLSWGSVLVVLLVAIFIGLSFGTYPAWKAARLMPVDAIRRE
jgi:putative ABC transport system permease protein